MKIFQIVNNICYCDMTAQFPTLKSTEGRFSKDTLIVEAPEYVFQDWGYDPTKEGDERFIHPVAPEGWLYDDLTGTFYQPIPTEEIYKVLVQRKIRKQYPETDEFKTIREYLADPETNKEAFVLYNNYVEQCKTEARAEAEAVTDGKIPVEIPDYLVEETGN